MEAAMKLHNLWGHFHTITAHKFRVMKNCFRVGLYKQGLLHDLSKYSPEEFIPGVIYYQGTYWIDFTTDMSEGLRGHKMPLKYVIEMMMDRIAASKTYKGKDYTDASPWEYYIHAKKYMVIAPETAKLLEELLLMLKENGEVQLIRRAETPKDYFATFDCFEIYDNFHF